MGLDPFVARRRRSHRWTPLWDWMSCRNSAALSPSAAPTYVACMDSLSHSSCLLQYAAVGPALARHAAEEAAGPLVHRLVHHCDDHSRDRAVSPSPSSHIGSAGIKSSNPGTLTEGRGETAHQLPLQGIQSWCSRVWLQALQTEFDTFKTSVIVTETHIQASVADVTASNGRLTTQLSSLQAGTGSLNASYRTFYEFAFPAVTAMLPLTAQSKARLDSLDVTAAWLNSTTKTLYNFTHNATAVLYNHTHALQRETDAVTAGHASLNSTSVGNFAHLFGFVANATTTLAVLQDFAHTAETLLFPGQFNLTMNLTDDIHVRLSRLDSRTTTLEGQMDVTMDGCAVACV